MRKMKPFDNWKWWFGTGRYCLCNIYLNVEDPKRRRQPATVTAVRRWSLVKTNIKKECALRPGAKRNAEIVIRPTPVP